MPQVPMLNTVQQAGLPNAKFSTDVNSEAFGAGAAKPQAAALALGDTALKMAADSKRRADDAATKQFEQEINQQFNKLLHDPKNGALFTQGQNAFDIENTYGQEFDKFTNERIDKLSDPSQKGMAKLISQNYRTRFTTQLNVHTGGEIKKYNASLTTNGVKLAGEDAILNYNEPGIVDEKIRIQEGYLRDHAINEGWSAEQTAVALSVTKSQTQSGVILKMLDDGKDTDALKYYDSIKDQVIGSDRNTVSNALETAKIRGGSIRKSDEIMGKRLDLGQSLAQAREIEDPKLRDETTRRIKERFSEKKAIEEEGYQSIYEKADRMAYEAKSIDAIPASYMAKLKPQDIETIKKRSSGTQATDYSVYTSLKMNMANGDTSLINMNPAEFYNTYRGKLADTEYKEIVNDMEQLRKQDKNTKEKYDGYRTEAQIVNDNLSAVGIKTGAKSSQKDKQLVAAFKKEYDEQIQIWKQENKKTYIPNTEAQKIADDLLKERVIKKGWLWDDKQRKFEDKNIQKLSGRDQRLYEWAIDNPFEPKSKAILQKLGIK